MPKEPIPFVLLDSSILTNGLRVLVEGVDTSQFEVNPVMLFMHESDDLPIGKWLNPRKELGVLMADTGFDYEDTDPEVQRIIGKVERGIIKMASAGLVDLELSDDPIYKLPGQVYPTVIKCRLREASIVPIGGNHNALALRLYDNDGNEIKLGKKDTGLKLADFIVKPNIKIQMSKKYLQILNLADTATDEMIDAAIQKLHDDKEAADLRATNAENTLNELKLADTQAKRSAFEQELDAAFKDGRLTEKPEGDKLTPVRDGMLNLFDKDPEGTRTMLGSIAKPTSLQNLNLGDKDSKLLKELEGMSWDEMDKKGKSLLCKDSYPDLWKEKFRAKFGTDPQ